MRTITQSEAVALLEALRHLMRYDFGDSDGAVRARAAIATVEAPHPSHWAAYVSAAQNQFEDEGTCEVDDGAIVSEPDEPDEPDAEGAYVQAWVWVPNTDLEDGT